MNAFNARFNRMSSYAALRGLASLLVCVFALCLKAQDEEEQAFTIAVLPDSQVQVAADPQVWFKQCQWIVNNRAARNIRAVIHVGDLVDNPQQAYQWTNAMIGLNMLRAANIPLVLAPGNHDLDDLWTPGITNLTRHLPQSYFTSNPNWSGGFADSETIRGSYMLLTNGPTTYLILGLSWAPAAPAVNWARSITAQYSNCPTIFVTHCFVDDSTSGRRASWSEYYSIESLYGDQAPYWTPNRMWDDWLKKCPSLFWIISGHLTIDNNSMYFCEPAEDGHIVTQSLCDYQWIPTNYNSGMMQLLTVMPAEKQCHIETFSAGTGVNYTGWYQDYSFPLLSTDLPYVSPWLEAQLGATNGLVLWNGFDRTNRDGFVGLSSYSLILTGAIVTAPGGIYVNCYPAFSNMVYTPDIDALTGLSNFSASVWFRSTNVAPSGLGVIAGKFGAGVDGEWYLATVGASRLRMTLVNTSLARVNFDATTPVPINNGEWHYIVATYDGSIAKMYFDGDLIGSTPFSGRLRSTRHQVAFGGLDRQLSPRTSVSTPWGWIDRVKVWNRALRTDEISLDFARDLTSLAETRTEMAAPVSDTTFDVATEKGMSYVVRFAVAGNPKIATQQRMLVSWNNETVGDLALIQTNTANTTNWIYSTVVVSATNDWSKLQFKGQIGDCYSTSGSTTNIAVDLPVADVSVTPFLLPSMRSASSQSGASTLEVPACVGFAYQLQSSTDLMNWVPASGWRVAMQTNLQFSVPPDIGPQKYYRVKMNWQSAGVSSWRSRHQ